MKGQKTRLISAAPISVYVGLLAGVDTFVRSIVASAIVNTSCGDLLPTHNTPLATSLVTCSRYGALSLIKTVTTNLVNSTRSVDVLFTKLSVGVWRR